MGARVYDVTVIGAGFAGLYALYRVRDVLRVDAVAFERSPDVGGVWLTNRYPGARVDMEAKDYAYRFSGQLRQDWQWSELFPAQPEILSYLRHVADRFDLRRDIQFDTAVTSLTWEAEAARWTVGTDDGESYLTRFVIAATGAHSAPKTAEFAGLGAFEGGVHPSAAWPAEGVDLRNKRVGVIGTGTSAVQLIPHLAAEAHHLFVFQRTPAYATPLRNRPTTWDERHETPRRYRTIRALADVTYSGMAYDLPAPSALLVNDVERKRVYDKYHSRGAFQLLASSFADLLIDEVANETVAQYIRDRIAERVTDPEVAELLTPRDYPYGAKRAVMEAGYYETFNRDNVTLVDVRGAPIERLTRNGLQTANGHYRLDSIVLAIGFDAFTGPLLRLGVTGRRGRTLAEAWQAGPRTYLGIASYGFPNLFMIAGPQSPTPVTNNVMSIEEHVEFAAGAIKFVLDRGMSTVEATAVAQDDWTEFVDAVANATLIPRANSWMMGANIPGKPRAALGFLAGAPAYRQICADVVANEYDGFQFN